MNALSHDRPGMLQRSVTDATGLAGHDMRYGQSPQAVEMPSDYRDQADGATHESRSPV